uniref:Secretory calcium-binding phosphoprotein 7 n=1 Tax=Syphacia muris TaxID=451379 RepID=A0A0N5B0P9_9BILA
MVQFLFNSIVSIQLLVVVTGFASTKDYLIQQYLDAITAYGPGLGVFAPFTYVDISYNDIPHVGKIPSLGKEGTSSHLGISPFYPENGIPGISAPTLYRANPLPPHVPEPVDVVAVPLDEEALHGEPLFPKELMLPYEKQLASIEEKSGGHEEVKNPFESDSSSEMLFWPSSPGLYQVTSVFTYRS